MNETPQPLRYQPSYEHAEDDERETQQKLVDTMRKIQETTYEDGGHAMRSVHVKSHGHLRGELRVADGLPPALAQGLFARPGTYAVAIRLSTSPGDMLDDSVSTPRGLAMKVLGVQGERLPGSDGDVTQDFVLVNGPAFVKSNAKQFLRTLEMLAATTDKMEGTKKVISATMRGAEKLVETTGGKSPALISMGGQPETNLLGETYYSQTPFLYGDYMAKLALAPVSPELTALTNAPLDVNGRPDALRETVSDFFRSHGGEWELRVQLCTDIDAMPIEDAKVVWPEDMSAYVAVATVHAPAQQTWSEPDAQRYEDTIAFSPWHGIAAHRPLGSVNRVRRAAYEMAEEFRARRNRRKVTEPRSLDEIPA
ncbi:MAG TPA: catalase family protein [Casimicrobiaceae bacterium]